MNLLEELNINQYRPLKELRKQQEKKLLKLIEHARSNVPYYRDSLEGLSIESMEDMERIPLLTKKKIRENLNHIRSENLTPERFISNSTGGSTGEKLLFYSDSNAALGGFALRGNLWTGWEPGDKQVQLWGAHYDLSMSRGFYEKLKRMLIHRKIILSSYDMTEEDMIKYLKIINRYRPVLITGYSSALALFSKFIRRNKLEVHTPAGIISSGETLGRDQRENIQSVFGCKVLDRYGCREVGAIAHECGERNGFHIFTEHVVLEVIDENGKHCKPGETGEIVITELNNYAFPFIRYKIGDIGVLSERSCPCGRNLPLLEKVKGRIWDVIVGANGNRIVGSLWIIKGIDGIEQYQVVQENRREIIFNMIPGPGFGEIEKSELVRRIREKCGEEMSVNIELVDEIPPTESGKHRYIISRVSPFLNDV